MKFRPKPLNRQAIVITGATSGIGLTTARMAAQKGARLMVVARNEGALRALTEELNSNGKVATYAVADVAIREQLEHAAHVAVSELNGFDTWINNAGVSIYGKLEEVSEQDSRRLFDTNFWGLVNGSLLAIRELRKSGGTLINVGSTLSDRAIPIQGMYCASKHAVKGFTDALRMELEADGVPVNVTLIKPSAIDTPYKDHAKNYMDVKPQNPPPVYAPETVAEAILYAAENAVRDLFVGAGGKMLSMAGNYAPAMTDAVMEATMIDLQKTDRPAGRGSKEGLFESNDAGLRERGGYDGHVAESSVYTKASRNTVAFGLAVGAVAVGVAGFSILKNRFDK
jgi:short-subunit dehydrogenase